MLVLYGGTGFIGRHICEEASRRESDVAVISRRPNVEFLSSLGTKVVSARAGTDAAQALISKATTVVYLANTSKPGSTFESLSEIVTEDLAAVTGFIENLYQTNPDCKFIYLSSGGQIYGRDHARPISEDSPEHPRTPYALSKLLNENMLDYFRSKTQASILVLRLANPIGHWQVGTSHGLVSAAVSAAITGNPLTIFGDGTNARDYFDVDDFAKFICYLHMQDHVVNGTFNIGSGEAKTERDVIKSIETSLELSMIVNKAPARDFDFPYAVLDVTRARDDLSWSPQTSLSDSIKKIAIAVKRKLADTA